MEYAASVKQYFLGSIKKKSNSDVKTTSYRKNPFQSHVHVSIFTVTKQRQCLLGFFIHSKSLLGPIFQDPRGYEKS